MKFDEIQGSPKVLLGALSGPFFIFGILLLALVLRTPRMGESLWLDETLSTYLNLPSAFHAFFLMLVREHLPFYYGLMFGWIRLFGDSEWSVRMPSLLAGLFSIPIAYRIARSVLDRWTSLLCTALLAISPVHIWYSTESRPYAVASLLLLISLWSFWKLSERSRAGIWDWIYAAASAAAILTQLYMCIFYTVFLAMAWMNRAPGRKRSLYLSGALLVLFGLFFLSKNFLSPIPLGYDYLRDFNPIELWALFFNWYALGNSIWTIRPYWAVKVTDCFQNPMIMTAHAFFLVLLLRGTFRLWNHNVDFKRSFGRQIVLLLLVVPAFLIVLGLIGFKKTYIERSCFMALPFFWIIVAAGASSFKNILIRWAAIFFLAGLVFTSLVFFLEKQDRPTVSGYKADWKGVARFFTEEMKEKGERFVIFSKTPAAEPVTYYEHRLPHMRKTHVSQIRDSAEKVARIFEAVFGNEAGWAKRIRARLAEDPALIVQPKSIPRIDLILEAPASGSLNGLERFYVIEALQWSKNTPALIKKLSQRADVAFSRVVEFKGVRIYEFELNKPSG